MYKSQKIIGTSPNGRNRSIMHWKYARGLVLLALVGCDDAQHQPPGVHETRLSNGTRCAVVWSSKGAQGITCDWEGQYYGRLVPTPGTGTIGEGHTYPLVPQ